MSLGFTDTELLDYLQHNLPDERREELRKALASSEETRERFEVISRMHGSLVSTVDGISEARDTSLLTDNIMRSIERSRASADQSADSDLAQWLSRLFRPVVGAALAMIFVLATYNYMISDVSETDLSAAEAVLGLPEVSIASAYEAAY